MQHAMPTQCIMHYASCNLYATHYAIINGLSARIALSALNACLAAGCHVMSRPRSPKSRPKSRSQRCVCWHDLTCYKFVTSIMIHLHQCYIMLPKSYPTIVERNDVQITCHIIHILPFAIVFACWCSQWFQWHFMVEGMHSNSFSDY